MSGSEKVYKLEKKNPTMDKNSFQSIYREMDAVSVFIAFEIINEINDYEAEFSYDIKQFIRAEVEDKLHELEGVKGRNWMMVQALLLQRMQAKVLSNNRKALEFMLYAYDIGDSMFAFEKNILKIVLNIDEQLGRLEGMGYGRGN